jgi:GT2 family glycosyltransferase
LAVRETQPVTIVIPVFNAVEEVNRCLLTLQQTVSAATEVLVIDDASTDPAIGSLLDSWRIKSDKSWSFHSNRENLGFVATANLGMNSTANDVVLLNSDTEVTPGWLEGLQRCLASDPRVATATPWTNNGEIASLPDFCRVNPVPANAAGIARVIAGTGAPEYPDLPTAVGFCMAIPRRAIERIGLFDDELFGKGYGEENDYSMRAVQAGMRNVLCDDVYVVHIGGRSFGPTGLKPDESSMSRLLSRHPDYLRQVQEFIDADPLSRRREAILEALNRAGVPIG